MRHAPRVVVVSRASEYDALLAHHGTREQARFFLERRGRSMDAVEARHHKQESALQQVSHAIPLEWRRTRLDRTDLCRFVFEPEDVVLAVGQDGLVANAAKYLEGQPVIGVNPDPAQYDGVLVRHAPDATADLLRAVERGRSRVEERTMVEAQLDDGQRLVALNELFVGHQSHQSARYRLRLGERSERQSSSGLIVATGTGATGWARSIHLRRQTDVVLPSPTAATLAFFVREAFPSVSTGTTLTDGALAEGQVLQVVSEMNEGGVVFGDGIEEDRLEFPWGARCTVNVSDRRLRLVR